MQIAGFVGAVIGDPVTVQFAFADVGRTTGPPASEFGTLSWVTDHGNIPAIADTITPSASGLHHTLITLTTHADSLQVGRYLLTAIEYADASGASRRLQVGAIVIDVRDSRQPPSVDFPDSTIGQLRLQFIELSVDNVTAQPIVVEGLDFEIPGTDVSTTMSTTGTGSSPVASGEPVGATPGTTASRVTVPADQQVDLRFDMTPADPSAVRFAELAPFLKVSAQGPVEFVPVPLQIYFGPFGGESDLTTYVKGLPGEASYRF